MNEMVEISFSVSSLDLKGNIKELEIKLEDKEASHMDLNRKYVRLLANKFLTDLISCLFQNCFSKSVKKVSH